MLSWAPSACVHPPQNIHGPGPGTPCADLLSYLELVVSTPRRSTLIGLWPILRACHRGGEEGQEGYLQRQRAHRRDPIEFTRTVGWEEVRCVGSPSIFPELPTNHRPAPSLPPPESILFGTVYVVPPPILRWPIGGPRVDIACDISLR